MKKYISSEDFIESQDPEIKQLLWQIRHTILNAHPKMRERILFGVPMFAVKKELCYFGVMKKNNGIEIGFHRGFQMSNEHGLLDAKKRTTITGITFKNVEDFQKKALIFNEILQEAIILDEINEKSIFSEILNAGRKKKS
jgi:uncharacterized protein YdhG (YjbR/CyaY superfamily)